MLRSIDPISDSGPATQPGCDGPRRPDRHRGLQLPLGGNGAAAALPSGAGRGGRAECRAVRVSARHLRAKPGRDDADGGRPSGGTPAVQDFANTLQRYGGEAPDTLERFAFYEAAKQAFAIVQTGERRPYGNIILTKGVIGPED